MPTDAVYVGRPTRWGNPFVVGVDGDRDRVVDLYRRALHNGELAVTPQDVRNELGGKDLVCWCRADQVCHADVLLTVANASPA